MNIRKVSIQKCFLLMSVICLIFSAASIVQAITYPSEEFDGRIVEFDHDLHIQVVSDSCSNVKCHGDTTPGKIEVTKRTAHGEMCKICHKQDSGPRTCSECHQVKN